jgi:manganese-dependent ADP-ribose/CDP-alcohol diphosphatase
MLSYYIKSRFNSRLRNLRIIHFLKMTKDSIISTNEIESMDVDCTNEHKPLLTFGIIADVQYGDINDEIVYGRMRYYRDSLTSVKRVVNDWKKYELETGSKVEFILQMGDIIEGFRVKEKEEKVRNIFKILHEFETLYPEHDFKNEYNFINSKLEKPIMPKMFHIYGNHEPYGVSRRYLFESPLNTARILNQNNDINNANYYYYDINDKLRLICLDLYEISILGYDEQHEFYKQAFEIIKKNKELKENSKNEKEKDYYERFAAHGGAISGKQLQWLEEMLTECLLKNKRVILSGHIPIKREAGNFHIAWNSEEILNLIWSFHNTVLVYLAGHYHVGGYFKDNHNVHHLTVSSILETPQSKNSYVTVKVFDDRVVFENLSSYIGNHGSFTAYF